LTSSYGTPSPCDTVVARVNPAGNFVYAIQLGGVDDGGPMLLLDPAGNIMVSGQTSSSFRFHPTPGAYLATPPEASVTGFVCKLAAADGTPMFCTFLDESATVRNIDSAGDLLFTLLVSSTTSGNSYAILKLDPTGSKLVSESVPVDGLIDSMVQNADGTFYLSGVTQSPKFPFSSPPTVPPSYRQPAYYYGKFDPNTGFLFAQDFGSNGFSVVVSSVGPLLAGYVGSEFTVRQYASDGTTIVYDRILPLYSGGKVSIVDGSVLLVGFVTSAALPLVHNLHVCGQVSGPFSGGPAMIRLDNTGAIVQTTLARHRFFRLSDSNHRWRMERYRLVWKLERRPEFIGPGGICRTESGGADPDHRLHGGFGAGDELPGEPGPVGCAHHRKRCIRRTGYRAAGFDRPFPDFSRRNHAHLRWRPGAFVRVEWPTAQRRGAVFGGWQIDIADVPVICRTGRELHAGRSHALQSLGLPYSGE